jgi:hypothetical protein
LTVQQLLGYTILVDAAHQRGRNKLRAEDHKVGDIFVVSFFRTAIFVNAEKFLIEVRFDVRPKLQATSYIIPSE